MLRRDVTLSLILYYLNVPVEIRYIIIENYFPFLPKERNTLTSEKLLKFKKDLYSFGGLQNHYIKGYCIIPDPCSSCNNIGYFLRINDSWNRKKNFFDIYIVRGNMHICSGIQLTNEHDENFYKMSMDASTITKENVDEKLLIILKWYRDRMMYAIEEVRPFYVRPFDDTIRCLMPYPPPLW